jgi:hypothetical protein
MTYKEQLQRVAKDYRSAGMPWPAASTEIAAWAIDNNLWQAHRSTLISRCAEEISDALREEYYTDPQGRRVRTKHVARIEINGKQIPLWDDIRSGNRDHFLISVQNRRQQIVGDCLQLKIDVDSFNENNNPGGPIQLILDFSDDVDERIALEMLESIGS